MRSRVVSAFAVVAVSALQRQQRPSASSPGLVRRGRPALLFPPSWEWEQDDEKIVLRVPVDLETVSYDVDLDVNAESLQLSVDDSLLMQTTLFGRILPDETLWFLDDDEASLVLEATLYKASRKNWPSLHKEQEADDWRAVAEIRHTTTELTRFISDVYDDAAYARMRDDRGRTEAYRKAIKASVKGKTVLDIGTGALALLALMCVDAGATHVYAMEASPASYAMAVAAVKRAGASKKVTVIRSFSTDYSGPKFKVDMLVHELVGNIATGEGMGFIIRDARRKFLKKSSASWSIPRCAGTFAVPVEVPVDQRASMDAENAQITSLLEQAGADTISQLQSERPHADLTKAVFKVANFPLELKLADTPLPWERLTFADDGEEETSTDLIFEASRDGVLGGFLMWCFLSFGEDVIQATDEGSHWDPLMLLIPPTTVRRGDRIRLQSVANLDQLQPRYTFKVSTQTPPS